MTKNKTGNEWIYVTGYRGRLGSVLMELGCSKLDIDVTDPSATSRAISKLSAGDMIVHLAGKTNVDWCEKKENQEELIEVNVRGTYKVLDAANTNNIPVVLLSSNHVFSGNKLWGKYKETDKQKSVNAYGVAKHVIEGLSLAFDNSKVVRSSYLFSWERLIPTHHRYPTFFKRNFTYINHFAEMLIDYCYRYKDMPKILHLASSDGMSWYKFMQLYKKVISLNVEILPNRKYRKDGFTPRPKNCVLDVSLSKKLGIRQYSIEEGLHEMYERHVTKGFGS